MAAVRFEDFEGFAGTDVTPADMPETWAVVTLVDGVEKRFELTMMSDLIREIVGTTEQWCDENWMS